MWLWKSENFLWNLKNTYFINYINSSIIFYNFNFKNKKKNGGIRFIGKIQELREGLDRWKENSIDKKDKFENKTRNT